MVNWRELRTTKALWLLAAVAAVDVALAIALRSSLVIGMIHGRVGWAGELAVFALAWLAVLFAAAFWAGRRIGGLTRTVSDHEAHLAALHATSREWLWQATSDFVFTSCSPGTAAVLGYRPEQLVGHSFFDFLDPADHDQARSVRSEAMRTKRGWHDVTIRWRHADGHTVTFQGSAVPMLAPNGQVIGFRGSRRPMTVDIDAQQRWDATRLRITHAIEQHQVTVALQPIIEINRRAWAGVEALARFPDNKAPDEWLRDAQRVGLAVQLELEMFHTALTALHRLPAHLHLSFNASPQLICDERFRQRLVADPGLDLSRLVLEITEHTAITDYAEIHEVLAPLRERGLRLAVDDTGAGYASFAHVLKLRPDLIKLDRSLLADLSADPARRVLVTSMVLLALELGAAITAEGVETLSELRVLAALGVDYAQGYLLARPSTDQQTWEQWRLRQWPAADLTRDASEAATANATRQRS